MISVTRTHEICAGHRVVGHEGKCKNLHGHNYLFEFTLEAEELDTVGRVIDFSVIKSRLCEWLENNWDHKMLLWNKDHFCGLFHNMDYVGLLSTTCHEWVVTLPCNPTAENIALYFCEDIAPGLLLGTNARLVEVRLWETSKCYVTYRVKEENDKPFRNGREDLATTKSRFEESIQKT